MGKVTEAVSVSYWSPPEASDVLVALVVYSDGRVHVGAVRVGESGAEAAMGRARRMDGLVIGRKRAARK